MNALISGRAGRALLLDRDSLSSFDVADPTNIVPRKESDLTYLFGEARDLRLIENTDVESVKRELNLDCSVNSALDLTLILLDGELADDIRNEALTTLDVLVDDHQVVERLENILYARPLPEDGDIEGALKLCDPTAITRSVAFIQTLAQRQQLIAEVSNAWDAIPTKYFAGYEQRQEFHRVAAREGLFRQLVTTLATGNPIDSVFVSATHMNFLRSLPEHEKILSRWIAPFRLRLEDSGPELELSKPFHISRLESLITETFERRAKRAPQAATRDPKTPSQSRPTEYFGIIGTSEQMRALFRTIESAAKSNANVLIVGEPGSGKKLIANAIHHHSSRSAKPLIRVNCAALPEELIESELFGHSKGAFTGAHADKAGLVQDAAGGSLMLDEIAEMPVALQPKLLRLLEERSYRRIGSEKTYTVDFRLISSTNRPPADAIRDGLLRDDLFYRISTIAIHVPPLRERKGDIQLLTEHFLQMFSEKHSRPLLGISQAAFQLLFDYSWPGNVRELAIVIQRAVLLARTDTVEVVDLPFDEGKLARQTIDHWDLTPNLTLEETERLLIEKVLKRTKGDRQAAANLLGIYRPVLYRKIRKYNIDVKGLSST